MNLWDHRSASWPPALALPLIELGLACVRNDIPEKRPLSASSACPASETSDSRKACRCLSIFSLSFRILLTPLRRIFRKESHFEALFFCLKPHNDKKRKKISLFGIPF